MAGVERAVREELYRANVHKAGDENAPLISQILSIKQQQAQILGYETHAEVSIERKMAASVEAVDELTEMLLAKAMPAAKKVYPHLAPRAAQQPSRPCCHPRIPLSLSLSLSR